RPYQSVEKMWPSRRRPDLGNLPEVARQLIPIAPRVRISRDRAGLLELTCAHPLAEILFVLDDGDPIDAGKAYREPFELTHRGTIKAVAVGQGLIPGPVCTARFDLMIPRDEIKVVYADSEQPEEGEAFKAIDGDPHTYWHTQWGPGEPKHPHELRIDLGDMYELEGVRYLPRQDSRNGRIADYEIFVSVDGKEWGSPVAAGKLPDTSAEQRVVFDRPVTARFLRVVAKSEVAGRAWTTIAELDAIAK
ncbi:MAG: discoidin domain-containing protein, partial [Ralstonia sp.]